MGDKCVFTQKISKPMLKLKTRIGYILLSLIVLSGAAIICLHAAASSQKTEGQWKDFQALLYRREVIIDGVRQERKAYVITNKESNPNYGDTLEVFQKGRAGDWKRIYENDFKNLKLWKIELADIDGDGQKELVTAVRKTTRHDKAVKNRLFIFNYTDGVLIKKWTGSQIAGSWKSFTVGDLVDIKGDEVLFISKARGGDRIKVYYWFEFGFFLLAESEVYENVTGLSITGENRIHMNYRESGEKKTADLTMKEGRLIELQKDK